MNTNIIRFCYFIDFKLESPAFQDAYAQRCVFKLFFHVILRKMPGANVNG